MQIPSLADESQITECDNVVARSDNDERRPTMKWTAHFNTGYLNMPGLGRARTGYQCSVQAPDEEAARVAADIAGKEFDSRAQLTHLTPVFMWEVKVQGKDKRKRETFIIESMDEEDAVRRKLKNREAVTRFAGYKPVVLSIKNLGQAD